MENSENSKFALPIGNVKYILAGLALMILGYVLMSGGGTDNSDVFTGEKMFSFTRVVIAPVLILAGFVVEIFAIMYQPKKK